MRYLERELLMNYNISRHFPWKEIQCKQCETSFLGKKVPIQLMSQTEVEHLDYIYYLGMCPMCGAKSE